MAACGAFAPPAALAGCGRCRAGARAQCARRAPPRAGAADSGGGGGRLRRARRWGAGVLAAAALAAGGVPRAFAEGGRAGAQDAAAAKELRYDGRAELGGAEKMLSLALTGGAFAGLSMWAWRRNRADDELEQIRIREEVERLEKLKAEFMDVDEDEDSLDDEDLQKELSKRLDAAAAAAAADGADADEGDDPDAPPPEEEQTPPPAAAAPDALRTDKDGAESLDMLRRMWDATDDEKDSGKPGSAPAAGQ